MTVEIRLRRKGKVETIGGFPESSIPEIIRPKNELEGIDLTGYPVILVIAGRHGDDRAKSVHSKAPKTIVVYKYEWRNGWGEGVFLPEKFNPKKVRFYKTESQLEEDKKEEAIKFCGELRKDVLAIIPEVNVLFCIYANYSGVEINPKQEAFSFDWEVRASTVEKAISEVEKVRPIWNEWNERALETYLRVSGKANPGTGNIQIHPSPTRADKVGVKIGDEKWIIFEKKDDYWKEAGVSHCAPLK